MISGDMNLFYQLLATGYDYEYDYNYQRLMHCLG